MKKNITTAKKISQILNIPVSRGMEAVIKAQLIFGINAAVVKNELTHQELAIKSGLPRSAVTGILSGSLQKITIDRVLKLVEAVGLVAEVKLKKAA
jgi:predicted XRE-type DNA-binding protein